MMTTNTMIDDATAGALVSFSHTFASGEDRSFCFFVPSVCAGEHRATNVSVFSHGSTRRASRNYTCFSVSNRTCTEPARYSLGGGGHATNPKTCASYKIDSTCCTPNSQLVRSEEVFANLGKLDLTRAVRSSIEGLVNSSQPETIAQQRSTTHLSPHDD